MLWSRHLFKSSEPDQNLWAPQNFTSCSHQQSLVWVQCDSFHSSSRLDSLASSWPQHGAGAGLIHRPCTHTHQLVCYRVQSPERDPGPKNPVSQVWGTLAVTGSGDSGQGGGTFKALEGLEKRLHKHESLGPQRPIKRPSQTKHVCSSSSGELEPEGPLGTLGQPASLNSRFSERPVLKNKMENG